MKNCFVIVNYNDYESTKHLVDNIIDYKCIDEIVIVDNSSTEAEKKLLSTIKNKKINMLYNETNLGYSSAINIGARYLIDKYENCNLIISNSDIVILNEEDIEHMLDLLGYESIGVVGPQVIERGEISRGWKSPTIFTDMLLNIPFLHAVIKEKKCEYKNDYYNENTSVVESLSTSFFMISSKTLQQINYLDENIFLYYEDNILGEKVRNLGLLVVIDNLVKIKHNYAVTMLKNYDVRDRYKVLFKSQIYFHSTYHKANKFQRLMLALTFDIGNFFRKPKKRKKKKNSK